MNQQDFRAGLAGLRDALRQDAGSNSVPAWNTTESLELRARTRTLHVAWAACGLLGVALGVAVWNGHAESQKRLLEAERQVADTDLLEQVNAGLARPVPRALSPLMRAR
jgi:hypothetical protein